MRTHDLRAYIDHLNTGNSLAGHGFRLQKEISSRRNLELLQVCFSRFDHVFRPRVSFRSEDVRSRGHSELQEGMP